MGRRAKSRLVGARCGRVRSVVGGRVGRARPGSWAVECGPTLQPAAGSVGRGCRGRMGGNCSIRGATRRRHAVAVRLMVQNPPLSGLVSGGWAGRRPGVAGRVGCGQTRCCRGWSGVGGRVGRARPGDPSLVAGGGVVAAGEWGNCSIRGATRRRHAVAVRLVVQNPPLGGWVWVGGRSRGWWGRVVAGCGPALAAAWAVVAAGEWGELQHEGCDTPATRRGGASSGAKPPLSGLVSGGRAGGLWPDALLPGVGGGAHARNRGFAWG